MGAGLSRPFRLYADRSRGEPASLRAHARSHGWHNLRLVSAGDSTFKYDFRSEDEEGHQDSAISVFTRDAAGLVSACVSAARSHADRARELVRLARLRDAHALGSQGLTASRPRPVVG